MRMTLELASRIVDAALAAGRERALENYTATAMTDQYQRAFARVLGREVAGTPT